MEQDRKWQIELEQYIKQGEPERAEKSAAWQNAIVRANFNDFQKGIHAVTEYLDLFFENLLMGKHYELKNRYLHVDYTDNYAQSANEEDSKCKNCTLDCTLDELSILKLIIEKPDITQKELAKRIGKSERTVKNKIASLKEKKYIRRMNGKRNGKWEVLCL